MWPEDIKEPKKSPEIFVYPCGCVVKEDGRIDDTNCQLTRRYPNGSARQ